MDPLIIGLDAGGTVTRCLLSTLDGTVVARAVAGGANLNSSGGNVEEPLVAVLSEVVAQSTMDPSTVVVGVVAAAGAGGAGRARVWAATERAWRRAGLTGPVEVVTDLAAAFAAGTAAAAGVLLIAGTGAVAARFEEHLPVRRADGYGWLAGDEGSAVWIGREAVRAVLRALDGRGPATVLTDLLAPGGGEHRDDHEDRAQALLAAAFAAPPAALGRFAPMVSSAAAGGDAVAARIAGAAAGELLHTLQTVAGAAPVVLGGGLLLGGGPIAEAVRAGVRERFGDEPVFATDGAAGSAALAIARHTGRPVSDHLHQRLTGASR